MQSVKSVPSILHSELKPSVLPTTEGNKGSKMSTSETTEKISLTSRDARKEFQNPSVNETYSVGFSDTKVMYKIEVKRSSHFVDTFY